MQECLSASRARALFAGHDRCAGCGHGSGADLTALLCFFCEIRETYPISVSCAHVEHGIRGAASEEDMRL